MLRVTAIVGIINTNLRRAAWRMIDATQNLLGVGASITKPRPTAGKMKNIMPFILTAYCMKQAKVRVLPISNES